MGKLRYYLFCTSIVLAAFVPAQAEAEFTYDKNTFISYFNCLGIYPGTSLGIDEKVWLFSLDVPPTIGKIVHVIRATEAKKKLDALGYTKARADKSLWAEIGCASSFSGDRPESLARFSPELRDSLGFAIRGLPSGTWISQESGDSVAMELKNNPYIESVRRQVTEACYAPDSLIRVKRFPIRNGGEIVQLDIGKVKKASPEKRKQYIEQELKQVESMRYEWTWPEFKKEKLAEWEKKDFVESVEICRFFLDGNRVLKSEKISRRTGEDERVDTPTDMDTDNWADTTTRTLGFVSLNEGMDWDALLVDVGFEGIHYSIQRLNDSVVHYNHSLYTSH